MSDGGAFWQDLRRSLDGDQDSQETFAAEAARIRAIDDAVNRGDVSPEEARQRAPDHIVDEDQPLLDRLANGADDDVEPDVPPFTMENLRLSLEQMRRGEGTLVRRADGTTPVPGDPDYQARHGNRP